MDEAVYASLTRLIALLNGPTSAPKKGANLVLLTPVPSLDTGKNAMAMSRSDILLGVMGPQIFERQHGGGERFRHILPLRHLEDRHVQIPLWTHPPFPRLFCSPTTT